jgi:hypothetical protein
MNENILLSAQKVPERDEKYLSVLLAGKDNHFVLVTSRVIIHLVLTATQS